MGKFIQVTLIDESRITLNTDDISYIKENEVFMRSLKHASPEYIDINLDLIQVSFELKPSSMLSLKRKLVDI